MRGKMSGGKISGPERYVRRMLREIADMIEAERRENAMKFRTKPIETEWPAPSADGRMNQENSHADTD